VIIGLAALTPFVTVTLMRLLNDPLAKLFGLLGRLAPRNVIRSQSRTAVAVAALMIAVSVTIGVQVMITSFRTTVTLWLEQTLRGDVYIAIQGLSATRLDTPLDMSLDVYRQLWDDNHLNGVVLFLVPGSNVDDVTAGLREQLTRFPKIQVNPSGALRQEALAVFDRTFAITSAMQMLTTLVAFIGVLSSLLALQLEKAREMGILRALGLTVSEMRRLTLWETGLLGASAGLLSLPTGYILAWILIFVINQRSFGWTLQMQADPAPFAQAFLLAVSAAVLAGLYPAWRIGRMQTAEALRGE
jgi:putative ABC transport system permease protein